jgi:hypothetical protein
LPQDPWTFELGQDYPRDGPSPNAETEHGLRGLEPPRQNQKVHGDKAGRPNGASYLGPVKLRKCSAGCFGCPLREEGTLFPADTQASHPEAVANATSRGTPLTGETVPSISIFLATRCGCGATLASPGCVPGRPRLRRVFGGSGLESEQPPSGRSNLRQKQRL